MAANVLDGSNFTRWQPEEDDPDPSLVIDLGKSQGITRTELFLYRPTLGHAYRLEASLDGKRWNTVAEHSLRRVCSPQVDRVETAARYLRLRFLEGNAGVWEVRIFGER